MATPKDTDYILVNRNEIDYKTTYGDFKSSIIEDLDSDIDLSIYYYNKTESDDRFLPYNINSLPEM